MLSDFSTSYHVLPHLITLDLTSLKEKQRQRQL